MESNSETKDSLQVSKEIKPRIIEVDIEEEVRKSFLDYSMTVIVSRALPDVRDGLKPVHRRILYTLFEDGLTPEKAYRKCANTVGSVLGRYHPHGDSSVYDALVRLAQPFSLRYTLVDGHGNFGSIDGDPPAAYRYTESRMSKISIHMLADIDKDTVDFVPNYDDRLKEPTVLPCKFPNLLVNGSTGIAVGMATNIPPHNLREVVDAMCFLIGNPEAEIGDLLKYIKGPDFPTGAIVMGRTGMQQAYLTGRGKIVLRAKTEIVEESGRTKIVVTELPYQVNKARMISEIAKMVKEHKISGVSDIEDHSDRNGMHIEITLKKDANPKIVENQLFSCSELQITFGAIMLAIVNGEPKLLNLKEMLTYYIDFQVEVVTRKTKFELRKAEARIHILNGLSVAVSNIDEVIRIIRGSDSVSEAREKLSRRFQLDDLQTQAIVQMPLGRLTGLELENEISSLNLKIADLKDILQNKFRILKVIKDDAQKIKQKFGDSRRTQISEFSGDVVISDTIPNEKCILTFTKYGYIKRQNSDVFLEQRRGGKGVKAMTRRDDDIVTEMLSANSRDTVLFFTNFGRVYSLRAFEVSDGSRSSRGTNIANLIELATDERITSIFAVSSFEDGKYLFMVTKFGIVKKTALKKFENINRNGKVGIILFEGDELVAAKVTSGNDEIFIATRCGMSIKFRENVIRNSGNHSHGVKSITLEGDDDVIDFLVINEDSKILTISENGFGGICAASEYRLQGRHGKGLHNYNTKKYGKVAAVAEISDGCDIAIVASDGVIIRIYSEKINQYSRCAKGVKLIRLSDGDTVVAVACLPHEENIISNDLQE